ncbi:MAG: hypothetical protein WKF36_01630 [Candidatus Nitrosocosmicus sp.]
MTSLTDELKKYSGIKMAKREQTEKLDKLSKEINALEKQKKDPFVYFKSASYAIIIANNRVFYCKKIFEGLAEYVKDKINVTNFIYLLSIINLIGLFSGLKREDNRDNKRIKTQKERKRAIKG